MAMIRDGSAIRLLLVLILAAASWQLSAAPLRAQTAEVGARVRVTAPEHMQQPCVGRVVAATDPLVVQEENGTVHSIPVHQIDMLEVRQVRSFHSREALLGGLAGLVVGGIVGYSTYEDSCEASEMFCFDALGRGIQTFAGSGIGSLVGIVIGYYLTPERWRPVWRREVQADAGLPSRGVMLRVTIPIR